MKYRSNQLIYSPSDLSAHISCKHLTQLNKQHAKGEIEDPDIRINQVLDILREKGISFEVEHLEELKRQGLTVVEINQESSGTEQQTLEAMKSGADVIYQARLKEKDKWSGWADFLIKTDTVSDLGAWSYEVWDTKLANETKAGTILQLGLYTEKVASIQGAQPEFMGVIKPEGEERYRVDEYLAYVRLAKSKLENAIVNDETTYPDPVSFCDICKWWKRCNAQRRRDDHLHFVAGMGNSQTKELKIQGVATLEGLAKLEFPVPFTPNRGAQDTYNKLREQARLQYQSREEEYRPIYEVLELEEERGLFLLPEPSENDIYLDFEGDRMVEPDGLEYMIGYYFKGEYYALWAHNEAEEKEVFEQFVDFAYQLKQKDPSLHIYHYAPYETTALKRLMSKYASREDEIDEFLRSHTFVDLYRVVRQSVRASVEKYSIKDLEVFFGYERKMNLRELSHHKMQLELLLQTGNIAELASITKEAVQLYNQDDCESLQKLQAWLEAIRTDLINGGEEIPRPIDDDGASSDTITEHQERIRPIMDALLMDVPEIRSDRDDFQEAKYVLAHMLDWYRREKKSFWWEFFRLKELPIDELIEERKAIAYLEFTGDREPIARSVIDTYRFPKQECDLKQDKPLENSEGDAVGTLYELDKERGIIKIKKGPGRQDLDHPLSIMSMESINSKVKEEAIIDFGEWVAENDLNNDIQEYRAGRDLLNRTTPRFIEKPMDLDESVDSLFDSVSKLNNSYFPIQGPPGAGKSYTASHLILRLVKAGKKIGITALSHKVITNLVQKVWDLSLEVGHAVSVLQKTVEDPENPFPWDVANSNDMMIMGFGTNDILAGTTFFWAKEECISSVDYLFVDEAGQLSLIDTLAVSRSSANLVLLGDPQQLKQPQQGVHPEGTEVSALEHVLQDEKTMPEEMGAFLASTWRMHPSINQFISEQFYEGRLEAKEHLEQQELRNSKYEGSGLYLEEVVHEGNTSSSIEEVEKLREIVSELTSGKVQFVNEKGEVNVLTHSDIKIITPYNSQVQAIKEALPEMEVGTVDKFQGQEAPVIIYSVATSTLDDAPRGMDFLFSPNRLNVAISRARTRVIMVASPAIFEAECKSPYQIKLANAFCRFKELADSDEKLN